LSSWLALFRGEPKQARGLTLVRLHAAAASRIKRREIGLRRSEALLGGKPEEAGSLALVLLQPYPATPIGIGERILRMRIA